MNRKILRNTAALLSAGILTACGNGGTPDTASPWQDSRHTLRFDENGEFRILVFCDVHGRGDALTDLTKNNIALLVERESPDLVMFGGDNTWGISDEQMLKNCISDMVEILEEKQIPWGHVYGNHDAEGDNVPKEKQQKIYESFAHCVSQAGDEDLPGIGNYVLPVLAPDSDEVLFNVWALDSGMYLSEEESAAYLPIESTFAGYSGSSYDYIRPEQIRWYTETSEQMEAYNGAAVPGLIVFHIPLQEYYNAWVNRAALPHTGEKREAVCASEINSGLFAALRGRGDVRAVVCGHDHINDYMAEYGGIKLCYSSTVSDGVYHNEDMFGARMFVIRADDPCNPETYMSYIDESRMEPVLSAEDAGPLSAGVLLDFDADEPELSFSGWNNNVSAEAETDGIAVEILDQRGLDGTRALGVTRHNFADNTYGNNAEVRISLETPGLLGENRYLRIWMDLTGETAEIDFRKASFGVVENYRVRQPYRTDDNDTPTPFYYLPADGTEWQTMKHGGDGCFGQAEGSSVRGLRGWFAFPLESMLQAETGAPLTPDTCITDIYFYYCLSDENMKGNFVILDDIALTGDYTVFD
ncbi:MAG: metallophosphoesterase family protein [Clostridia bacterium]|nr:metallophosphoesterase family protein [Clostridia bacterium]